MKQSAGNRRQFHHGRRLPVGSDGRSGLLVMPGHHAAVGVRLQDVRSPARSWAKVAGAAVERGSLRRAWGFVLVHEIGALDRRFGLERYREARLCPLASPLGRARDGSSDPRLLAAERGRKAHICRCRFASERHMLARLGDAGVAMGEPLGFAEDREGYEFMLKALGAPPAPIPSGTTRSARVRRPPNEAGNSAGPLSARPPIAALPL